MPKIRTSRITEQLHKKYPDANIHSVAYNETQQVGYATIKRSPTMRTELVKFEYNSKGLQRIDFALL